MQTIKKQQIKEKFLSFHCNIDDIASKEELAGVVKALTMAEQQKAMKFRLFDDQRRAVLSILLQRKVIRDTFKVSDNEYMIARTRESKPFLKLPGGGVGTWNYNVSHHGKFVSIAADPHYLVGVDIVDISTRSSSCKASCSEYIKMFSGQLTAAELTFVLKQGNDDDKMTCFFQIWSLKESYIKAIGLGLGFDLSQINFEIQFQDGSLTCGTATATIKGAVRHDWAFEFFALNGHHIMSVARGPVADALPSYAEAAQLKVAASPVERVMAKPSSRLGKNCCVNVSMESLRTPRQRANSTEVMLE